MITVRRYPRPFVAARVSPGCCANLDLAYATGLVLAIGWGAFWGYWLVARRFAVREVSGQRSGRDETTPGGPGGAAVRTMFCSTGRRPPQMLAW